MSDLQVVITGRDGASRVFQEVSRSAKAAGDAVEAAGKEGAEGLKQIDRAADTAEQSLASAGGTARRTAIDFDAIGAAAVAVGGYLTIAGNSAIDQMQILDGLRAQFGDVADDYIALADTIAANSIFNDDDIMRGMQYFAVLREEYGLTDQQLRDLMQTTADLATVRGTTFEDASSRVTGAIRGEAEAAEYLGLSLQQSAIDRENLTLTMNNQERAQFQLNALNQQAAYAQGQAAAALDTDVGRRAALTNAIQDNTQAVGNFLGPYNAMIAGMATGAIGLAQFAGGFGALASGIRTVTTASAAFVASPLGLTVTALGAAVAVATGMWFNHKQATEEAAAAWAAADQSGKDLTATINQMTLAGDAFGARFARSIQQALFGEHGDGGQLDWYRDMLENVLSGEDTSSTFYQSIVSMMERAGLDMGPAGAAARSEFVQGLMPTADDEIALNAALTDLFSLFSNPNIDQAELQQNIQDIYKAFDDAPDGSVTFDQLTEQFVALYQNSILAVEGTTDLAGGMTNLAGTTLTATEALFVGSGAVTQFTGDSLAASTAADALEVSIAAVTTAAEILADGLPTTAERSAQSLTTAAVAANEVAVELAAAAAGMRDLGDAASTAGLDAAAAAADLAAERAERLLDLLRSVAGLDNPLDQWNAVGLGTGASAAAAGILDAASALEDVFRVIVGNTNAIGQQVDAVNSWAEELIGVQGEYAIIDDLLAAGVITLDQYNAAQQAQVDIATANAAIQQDIQAIQAQQAPLIAEHTAALEQQMGIIAQMPADQQLVALAWMDSATAAQAFEIQALAASAAMGELGANGEANVTKMIEGLIAADPALEALLVDMGLISVTMDEFGNKTISVNFEGADQTLQVLQELTQSIQMLTDYLDDGEINGSIEIEDNATPVIEAAAARAVEWDDTQSEADLTVDNSQALAATGDAQDAADAFDSTTATATLQVNDLASGVIAGALGALNAIDGYAAVATVTTRYVSQGVGPTKRHGGIPNYAMGGTLYPVWTSEAGPEIAHLATGGSIPLYGEGMRMLPAGAFVEPANSARSSLGGLQVGPFIIQGSVITERELIGKAAETIWAVEVEEKIRERIAEGVLS